MPRPPFFALILRRKQIARGHSFRNALYKRSMASHNSPYFYWSNDPNCVGVVKLFTPESVPSSRLEQVLSDTRRMRSENQLNNCARAQGSVSNLM
jgi:hypothetical protein